MLAPSAASCAEAFPTQDEATRPLAIVARGACHRGSCSTVGWETGDGLLTGNGAGQVNELRLR